MQLNLEVAGLCGRCGRRPQQWGDVLCAPCGHIAHSRRRLRQRLATASRWFGACLAEGLVGVGAGALALWPALAATGSLGGAVIIAGLLATLLALAVFLSGCWLLRPLIRRWGGWAAVDAAEVLLAWAVVTGVVLIGGYAPGILGLVGLGTGGLAALVQGRVIAAQTTRAPHWVAASIVVWGLAGGAGLAVELTLPGTALGVIAGAGLGRLLYGIIAGPILAWTLAR